MGGFEQRVSLSHTESEGISWETDLEVATTTQVGVTVVWARVVAGEEVRSLWVLNIY